MQGDDTAKPIDGPNAGVQAVQPSILYNCKGSVDGYTLQLHLPWDSSLTTLATPPMGPRFAALVRFCWRVLGRRCLLSVLTPSVATTEGHERKHTQ